ncbi:hypothetical protein CRV01_04605 [Arcobacter sp. CECT 8983]|uniref:HNH endonuclease n=1 Tax=Arcobacter sp. CECT 8983 TaxID=2044508 RepID=UPI00100AB9C4|nr:HNH endonuclease signature motif containing protein [Arcobacter sp. CECT 8983]RXJ90444.1 hypothetical protein CRV01_04605 [Arcobacter sp. CECT 8983]
MAIYNTNQRDNLERFNEFHKEFILNKRCYFTGEKVFNHKNIKEYENQIIKGYDNSDRSNQAKYRDQIIKGMSNSKSFNLFFTNIYYLYDLFRQTDNKINRINFYLNCYLKDFDVIKKDKTSNSSDSKIKKVLNNINLNIIVNENICTNGIINSVAYNTNMYYEMNFIYIFLKKIFENECNYSEIIENIKFKDVIYLKKFHSKVIHSFVSRNALLYLFYPKKYEPILSYGDKKSIITYYLGSIKSEFLKELDIDLLYIRNQLNMSNNGFYDEPFNIWEIDKKISTSVSNRLKQVNTPPYITDLDIDFLSERERESLIKARIGQSYFRNQLQSIFKTCSICGIEHSELLVASHIKPWSKSNSDEKVDYQNNGLLLCVIHDKLFDRGFISFDDNGKIIISKKIKKEDFNKIRIDKKFRLGFEISKKMKEYLRYHRINIFYKSN